MNLLPRRLVEVPVGALLRHQSDDGLFAEARKARRTGAKNTYAIATALLAERAQAGYEQALREV